MHFMLMNAISKLSENIMALDRCGKFQRPLRKPLKQPDYADEISEEQLEAIRKLADPEGKRAKKRVLLYADTW